jgi:hypothetical protein
LREETLANVGHAQWVCSIPKMLRLHILFPKPLLGRPCQAARDVISGAVPADDALIPGVTVVVQAFSADLSWHPHIPRWRPAAAWIDRGSGAASRSWMASPRRWCPGTRGSGSIRWKVCSPRSEHGGCGCWRHSGFSVRTSVTTPPDDRGGLERPSVDEQAPVIGYAARIRPAHEPQAAPAPLGPQGLPRPCADAHPGPSPAHRLLPRRSLK